MKKEVIIKQDNIESKIFTIRGQKVIIDSDLAELYGVSTKSFNQSVNRNIEKFPPDFMFQLTKNEKLEVVTNCDRLKNLRFSAFLPLVFTEQGVAILAGMLNSDIAIRVNIKIIRAFVIMRQFISNNANLFERMNTLERKQIIFEDKTEKNFEIVFRAIEDKNIKPKQGIFFDGQVYDAHDFVCKLIKSSKKSITLIDNYVNENTLTLLSNKKQIVKLQILTKTISNQLQLAVNHFQDQYGEIEIKEFTKSHDRFMIIDEKEVYHLGASLKDLGKRWFAFSKLDKTVFSILSKL